nr:MAG TPA: hypothetical protein [Caudoviricetes sp.]DAR61131.1 MAG TPA: hypothetical protein [Bacteriophage sp.]DAS59241.1 MAG TPA: hypothetical protein [Caudoviricetes sp.]
MQGAGLIPAGNKESLLSFFFLKRRTYDRN